MVQRRIPVRDALLNERVVKEFDNAQHYHSFKIVGYRQRCLEPATAEPSVTRKDEFGLARLRHDSFPVLL
jgi:hypothetical protein